MAHTDVVTLNRSLWCSEAQSNVLVPSSSTLSDAGLRLRLGVQEDVRLLLERALRLHGEFGGHDCGVVGSRSRGVSRCVLRTRRLFNFQRVRLVCASGDVGQRDGRPGVLIG